MCYVHGFSLVELSIVLVILGLLVGGVLAGKSLIRAAEFRAAIAEYQSFAGATKVFKEKYFMVPGDITNATAFWGKDDPSCTGHTGTAATPGTCNGNGDGWIFTGVGWGAGQTAEIFRFWQHLQLAGLIGGSYTGNAGPSSVVHGIFGVNLPASRMSDAGWNVFRYGSSGDTVNFAIEHGNFFGIGKLCTNNLPQCRGLTPEEAWSIDTKLDDGKPAYGKVVASYWNNGCSAADDGTSANTDLNASYRLSDTTKQCALYFVHSF
jgi:prepilin-type N-terminal cleavage/methylation domain-containing protein